MELQRAMAAEAEATREARAKVCSFIVHFYSLMSSISLTFQQLLEEMPVALTVALTVVVFGRWQRLKVRCKLHEPSARQLK